MDGEEFISSGSSKLKQNLKKKQHQLYSEDYFDNILGECNNSNNNNNDGKSIISEN